MKTSREKKAFRLASFLWHLSKDEIVGKTKKEETIAATAESFLEDENWPYPDTTVPPEGFE